VKDLVSWVKEKTEAEAEAVAIPLSARLVEPIILSEHPQLLAKANLLRKPHMYGDRGIKYREYRALGDF